MVSLEERKTQLCGLRADRHEEISFSHSAVGIQGFQNQVQAFGPGGVLELPESSAHYGGAVPGILESFPV